MPESQPITIRFVFTVDASRAVADLRALADRLAESFPDGIAEPDPVALAKSLAVANGQSDPEPGTVTRTLAHP